MFYYFFAFKTVITIKSYKIAFSLKEPRVVSNVQKRPAQKVLLYINELRTRFNSPIGGGKGKKTSRLDECETLQINRVHVFIMTIRTRILSTTRCARPVFRLAYS